MQQPAALDDCVITDLAARSVAVRRNAYCRYSKFAVGAALLCQDGTIHSGCNVENVSYGLTICAERSAVVSAVSCGDRHFRAVAVCAEMDDQFVGPCGACRQVLAEFNAEMTVILCRPDGKKHITSLDKLLPDAFLPTNTNFNC